MRIFSALITILVLATAAQAGDAAKKCVQVAQLTAAPRPARLGQQVDQQALCHQQRARIENSIQGLRNQIAGAKTQLSQMSGLTFHCVDNVTSANNRGQMEYCTPNACLPDTGRCANEIHSTDDCAPGFIWDSSTGNCVAPISYQGGGNGGL